MTKRSLFLSAALLLGMPAAANATLYYVSATGKDTNAGTSAAQPFLTIPKAMLQAKPGDTVSVMAGSYPQFTIPTAGTPDAWINYQGQLGAIIKRVSGNGIQFGTSNRPVSYVSVSGFTVRGNADTITYAQAIAAPMGDPLMTGSCIDGYPLDHHIKIFNNDVSYCPGAGIIFAGDYVDIYRNNVHHNAYWDKYARSGITVQGANSDASTAIKIRVYDNIVHDNFDYLCNAQTSPCRITDGHGIISDSNTASKYTGRTQIYNNIVYHNGCVGLVAFRSNHVDIFNNTTYQNSQSALMPDPYSMHVPPREISVAQGDDIRVENNIAYGLPSPTVGVNSAVTNLVWDYNILYSSGKGTPLYGAHDIDTSPLFMFAPPYNFHMYEGTPAFATGTAALVPLDDFDGKLRYPARVDRGAYRVDW